MTSGAASGFDKRSALSQVEDSTDQLYVKAIAREDEMVSWSHAMRRARRQVAERRYRNRSWMRTLRGCQREVRRRDPHPHYETAYGRDELSYWLHIPRWIDDLRAADTKVVRVLDIGCGYGTLALFAKATFDCEVYCTDFTDEYLSRALAQEHGLRFAVNNIERDDFPWDLRFDIVILTEVLEHLNYHPVPTLGKIRRLLAPQGRLFLSTPDAAEWGRVTSHYERLCDIPDPSVPRPVVDAHVWQYNMDELLSVVHESGWTVERFAYSPGQGGRHFNLELASG
jgi:2-polyprenyl-3-methyl-5-hydroxy-6-metoxy-1,4-benzoquinol methylase